MKFYSRTLLAAATLSIGLLTATGANAALVSILGGQAIHDTDLNITWLADANYALTSGYTTVSAPNLKPGQMNWYVANSWIASLNAENGGAGHLGYNDWRLPTTLQPDASCSGQNSLGSYGRNCTGSEMGYLFYKELGGVAGFSITTTHNSNYDLFSNFQSNFYWSGTPSPVLRTTSFAWGFGFYDGSQGYVPQYLSAQYALAVRGQVVPVPTAALLFGSGLLGLVSAFPKRKVA